MKKAARETDKKSLAQRRLFSIFIVIMNVTLLVVAMMAYGRYVHIYQERLREENLGNIANLNQSSAMNATALISSWDIKLKDIARFISWHDMTLDEALATIEQTNSAENRKFQLIGGDYTGYQAQRDASGGYIPLSYQMTTYLDLQRAFDDVDDSAYEDVCFAPEFTDGYTALKYFAVYRHIPLRGEHGQPELYTLLLATRSSDVLAVFNSQNNFDGQSTVLIGEKGNYIVSNDKFKSDNFFNYLYVYNDLTLDQRKEIERRMTQSGSGELYYKDALGRDCVFRYERMSTNNWYCVTCVPIASFRTPVFDANYGVYAVLALLLMLVMDLAWLLSMNRRLRASVLREKEASDAKTDFLSRMSHDIRTPLNGIIGLTKLAMEEGSLPRVREYLDNIRVSGEFLNGLVNDVLDLSKVESGKVEINLEPYSCRDMCEYVEAVVTPLCKDKGLEFRTHPPDNGSPVLLDRLRFNQIIFNLLSNAVKYTPEGGFVELIWERTDLPENRVALDITVRDNGIGMSEAYQKHMFDSFSQERSQTADIGSGLGLAIVKSLIPMLNGSISVESKQGVGSTFKVHLETVACEEQNQPDASENRAVTLKGKRALLCEDNRINTIVAQRMLEKWGMRVDAAVNGRIGLDMFAASEPGAYDVILMDIMMPEMNGLDATRAIRALDRPDAATVPILAITANAYDTDVKNCLEAGMNAHTGKPIDQQQLHDLLSRIIIDKAS